MTVSETQKVKMEEVVRQLLVGVGEDPSREGLLKTPLRVAEGYRVGNFKPSFETIDAFRSVMLAAGVTPPADTAPISGETKRGYQSEAAANQPP